MTAERCFACSKFLIEKPHLEKHLEVCGSIPGKVYQFENLNILTFEDNVTFMGELPFAIYFDVETTSGKKVYEFDDIAEMYTVSYAFLVVFHPKLNLDRICVVRSFNHTLEMLNDVTPQIEPRQNLCCKKF